MGYFALEGGIREMVKDKVLPEAVVKQFFIKTASYSESRLKSLIPTGFSTSETRMAWQPCPYYETFQKDDDRAKFGDAIAWAIIACVRNKLIEAIVVQGISEEKAEQHMKDLHARVANIAAAAPKDNSTAGIIAFCHLQREEAIDASPPRKVNGGG